MPAQGRDPRVDELCRNIIDEILIATGLPPHGGLRKLLEPALWFPAQRFSNLAARFDEIVGQWGFCEAARRILPEFVLGYESKGADQIPQVGPLLVASNHPGAYDALAIGASLGRSDLKLVLSGVPFTRALPCASHVFIYATPNPQERMAVIRSCIRHLQSGGSVLIFPSGVVDPDPALFSGAEQALTRWSRSIEIMLKKVPQACLVPTIVCGVLDPSSFKNPLTRLKKGWEQRKLAEVIQLVRQMFFDVKYDLVPRVRFGRPQTAGELAENCPAGGLMDAVIENAQQVLRAGFSF